MPFCPNPECSYLKNTGKHAEFKRGVTSCSDCGSDLVETITKAPPIPKDEPKNLYSPLLITASLVILWRVLAFIPCPGINHEALQSSFPQTAGLIPHPVSSLVSLSIWPYVQAYVLVEILSLVIPPLKFWRARGYPGRMKLATAARLTTVFIAFFNGYVMARSLEGMQGPYVVEYPGIAFRLTLALTLTTGTLLCVWIADQITKRGIGHGISVLFISGYAHRFLLGFKGIFNEGTFYFYGIWFGVVIVAMMFVIVIVETNHRRIGVRFQDGVEAEMPLKLATAGLVPVTFAASLMMFPGLVATILPDLNFLQKMASLFAPDRTVYLVAYAIAIIIFYYFFTALFFKPGKMIDFAKERSASLLNPSEKSASDYIDKVLEAMAACGSVYLIFFVVFAPKLFTHVWGHGSFRATSLIITVAIALDLITEFRLRRKGDDFVKVAEFHDLPKAGLLKNLLAPHQIPVCLQGYYHRALLYFFGPFVEVSVLVPEAKAKEAVEIIDRYKLMKYENAEF